MACMPIVCLNAQSLRSVHVSPDLRHGRPLQESTSLDHELAALFLNLSAGALLRFLGLELLEQHRVLHLVDVSLVAVLEDRNWRVCAEGDQQRDLVGVGTTESFNFLDDLHGTYLLCLDEGRWLGVNIFKPRSCWSGDRHYELPDLDRPWLLDGRSV